MYTIILFETVIKCILIYTLGIVLSKVIGIKIISQINFFDFIMAVSIGSMIAKIVIDKDEIVFSGIVALLSFTVLTILTSYITMKSYKARGVINAKTLILIENGRIIDKNLRKLRITTNELMMKLRVKDIFNLEDVQFVIMESNGQISALLKSEKNPVTPKDMNIKVTQDYLVDDIIIDGKILEKNLKIIGVDNKWIESELKKQGITKLQDVCYAGVDKKRKLIISKKFDENYKPEEKYAID